MQIYIYIYIYVQYMKKTIIYIKTWDEMMEMGSSGPVKDALNGP